LILEYSSWFELTLMKSNKSQFGLALKGKLITHVSVCVCQTDHLTQVVKVWQSEIKKEKVKIN